MVGLQGVSRRSNRGPRTLTASSTISVETTLQPLYIAAPQTSRSAPHCVRIAGKREVTGSSVGFVPTNAPAVRDQSLERSRLPGTDPANFLQPRLWIVSVLPTVSQMASCSGAKKKKDGPAL